MPLEFRYVDDPDELRRIFNESRYTDMVETGELVEREASGGIPRRGSGQSTSTRSRRVKWIHATTGDHVATVHYYLKRDWTLGASGKPDPKTVRRGNIVYVLRPRSN